jgi:hypothetical protein
MHSSTTNEIVGKRDQRKEQLNGSQNNDICSNLHESVKY